MMAGSASLTNVPAHGADLGDEAAPQVDGVHDGQVVLQADAHVLFAEGRRDMHDAGAVGGGHVVAADHEPGSLVGLDEVVRRLVLEAEQLGARELGLDDGLLAEHRL